LGEYAKVLDRVAEIRAGWRSSLTEPQRLRIVHVIATEIVADGER
jgi:hypothetical protein